MGSERPFLFPTHPHEEARGKEEMKRYQLWASKEGFSRNDAQIMLPCCSPMPLGKGWGRVLDGTSLADLLLVGYPVGAKP